MRETVRPEEKTMRSRGGLGESAKCHSRKAGTRDIRHMAPELDIQGRQNSERLHEIICHVSMLAVYINTLEIPNRLDLWV